jgi:hypothetical protein
MRTLESLQRFNRISKWLRMMGTIRNNGPFTRERLQRLANVELRLLAEQHDTAPVRVTGCGN